VDKDGNLWFVKASNTGGTVFRIDLNIPCAVCSQKPAYLEAPGSVQDKQMITPGPALLEIAPNPVTHQALIKCRSGDNGKSLLAVYDIRGRVIERRTMDRDKITVRLVLMPGVYIARLKTGKADFSRKIVVTR
jgi:hypothetical protein